MAQKELVFKLKFVDENGAIVEKTAENIQDINKSISDLKKELENTELGSEAWNGLAEDLGKAENALEKTTEAINDTKNAQKSLGDQLTSAPGIVGQVSNSVKGLSQTFKALLANPVVAVIAAIVGALTLLFKAFTSTKAGGEKMEQVMAGIGAALDVLRDRVLKVGGAIIKFFSGDFAGAAEDIKGAFSGIGDEIASEFNEAMRIKAELQAITDATRELNNERAKQNTEIAKAKLVINDETKSYEEREQALQEVRQAEIALAKQEEILAQRRYEAIKAQNALSDSSKEALDEEAAAYQRLQQAQLASLQKQKELYDQEKALRDRRRAEQKARADKRKQELQQLADLEQQLNLDAIDDAEERAIKEAEIQKEAQIKQLKELNATAEQGQRILLMIVEQTQEKIRKIEEETAQKRFEEFEAYRRRLLSVDLEYINLQQQANDDFWEQILANVVNYGDEYSSNFLDVNYEIIRAFNEATGEFEEYLAESMASSMTSLEEWKNASIKYENELQIRRIKNEENTYQAFKDGLKRREELRDAELKSIDEGFDKEAERLAEKHNKGLLSETEYFTALEKIAEDADIAATRVNEAFNLNEENAKQAHYLKIQRLNKEHNEKLVKIEKDTDDAIAKIEEQKRLRQEGDIAMVAQGFNILAEIFTDNFEANKAFTQVETLLNTWLAAQKAFTSQIIPGDPTSLPRAYVAAGLAAAAGLARVAQIAATQPPEEAKAADGMVVGQGSGRMDNVSVKVSNGESIINARSTRMFGGLLSAINQAGGGRRFAAGGITGLSTQTSPETNLLNQISNLQGNTPIKTYVVSTEVSSSVSLDRQIKSRSVL